MTLLEAKRVYMLGIGGIGMSAVARLLLHKGVIVSGSDTTASDITDALNKLGIKIQLGAQKLADVPRDVDLIIYSAAIDVAEPQLLKEIKELKTPSMSYAEALGEISLQYKTIAIAGTHGKTTTTAMIAEVLKDAGLRPTVLVGSLLIKEQTNFVAGDGEYFVVEADDYREKFLTLSPHVLVITNIGKDHMEYFGTLENARKAYVKLAGKLSKDGILVADKNDSMIEEIWQMVECKKISYGDFIDKDLKLQIPGDFNRKNAACALATASALTINLSDAKKSLEGFPGTWRRFDFRGHTASGAFVYDDYAHNPDKVSASISGFRERFPKSKITVIFQPHLYSRTKLLLEEFSNSFGMADRVLVLPIYAAREAFDKDISSEMLVERLKKVGVNADHVSDFGVAGEEALKSIDKDSCIVTMGAGDVNKIADGLVARTTI